MKIAFVLQHFDRILPRDGGPDTSIAIWTQQVGQRLAAAGHEIIVYSNQPYVRGHKIIEQHDGMEHRAMPGAVALGRTARMLERFAHVYRRLEDALKISSPQKPPFAALFFHIEYSLQVALDLRAQNCDIVHIYHFTQYIPIIKWFNPRIKVVLSSHCEWLNELDAPMLLKRLRQADLIMSSSEHLTRRSKARFPEIEARFCTVYNGVDVTRFSRRTTGLNDRSTHPPRLLYVGRVSPEKGVHVLVEAFRQVTRQFPDAHLTLVGPVVSAPYEYMAALYDDPHVTALDVFYHPQTRRDDGIYYAHLQALLGPDLMQQVTFAGGRPYEEVAAYYQQADIFVFPSVCHEGFGIPVIEAMLSGLPVVSTRSGGVQETIQPGVTGILVERSDADALAQAMIDLLRDEERRQSMAAAGYERARTQFSWEQTTEQALKHYQAITGQ